MTFVLSLARVKVHAQRFRLKPEGFCDLLAIETKTVPAQKVGRYFSFSLVCAHSCLLHERMWCGVVAACKRARTTTAHSDCVPRDASALPFAWLSSLLTLPSRLSALSVALFGNHGMRSLASRIRAGSVPSRLPVTPFLEEAGKCCPVSIPARDYSCHEK